MPISNTDKQSVETKMDCGKKNLTESYMGIVERCALSFCAKMFNVSGVS